MADVDPRWNLDHPPTFERLDDPVALNDEKTVTAKRSWFEGTFPLPRESENRTYHIKQKQRLPVLIE